MAEEVVEKAKKSVADIIIERFLKDVDETGKMPWQRSYERYNAFNYFSKHPYRGINRLLLPFGEYMTLNQVKKYNLEKGYIKKGSDGKWFMTPDAYRLQPDTPWFPVVFFTMKSYPISREEVLSKFPDATFDKDFCFGRVESGYMYVCREGKCFKEKNILRYYNVTERQFFKNEMGEMLPSRIESGELVIEKSNPRKVIDDYVKRSGVNVIYDYSGTPCYVPAFDKVMLNPHVKSEDAWFSIAFHELGHSTGAAHRLNRRGVASTQKDSESDYAVEECIAEICACLCCAETGIDGFVTSETSVYNNSVAYVQVWKERVKNWGKDFIYIVSQADKAFNYICDDPDSYAKSLEDEEGNVVED